MADKRENKIRNEFTDALGEEISARKIFDKAKEKKVEDDLFLSEFADELIAEPIEVNEPKLPRPGDKVKAKKKSGQKKSKPTKKIPEVKPEEKVSPEKNLPTEKKLPPENIPDEIFVSAPEAEAETEFEKRIFAEADDDFYDEKIPQHIGDNMRSNISTGEKHKPVFRSKYFEEPEEPVKKTNKVETPDPDADLHRKLTHAEVAGVAISAIMLVYSFATLDKPLFFLALSLLSHLLRPLIGALCGKYNRPVQNALRSFSIAIFFGALIILLV